MNHSVYKPRIVYFRPEDRVVIDADKFLERDILNASSVCRIVSQANSSLDAKYTALQTLVTQMSTDITNSVNGLTTQVNSLKTQALTFSTDILKNKNDIVTINQQLISTQSNITSINNSITSLNTTIQNQANEIDTLNTNYTQLLQQVMELTYSTYPLIISLSGGGIYEKGTTPNITLTWSVSRNGSQITPTSQKINNVDVISPQVYQPTQDVTYTLYVTYNGQSANSSVNVKFVYPSYCGIVASDFVANSTTIVAMNKTIKDSSHFDITYSELDNQKVCYAYPKSYGNLSSIKDSNGFEYINSYILSTVTINSVDYNVYLLESSTSITNFKQSYS